MVSITLPSFLGNDVLCIDIDKTKVAKMQNAFKIEGELKSKAIIMASLAPCQPHLTVWCKAKIRLFLAHEKTQGA